MKIHFIQAIESFEGSIIRNKWFSLALISAAFIGTAYVYQVHATKDGVADCFRNSSEIAYSSARKHGERVNEHGEKMNTSVASGDLARAYFGMCLVINGVDTRTVPAFEELFPPMTISQKFQNDSFDVLDEQIFTPNAKDSHDGAAVE
jgi:hypothetical protein